MLETLFYILAFKAFPELSLLIFLIIKDMWDLLFKGKKKKKKLPRVFLSEAVQSIFPELGAPKE